MPEFNEEKRGYMKEEVDGYIKTFTEEYQKLLEELREKTGELQKCAEEHQGIVKELSEEKVKNTELVKKNRRLAEHLKSMTEEFQRLQDSYEESKREKAAYQSKADKQELLGSPDYGEAIASALITAEISAKRIIEEAERKSELVSEAATRNLGRILEAKQLALLDLQDLRNRLSVLIGEAKGDPDFEEEDPWINEGDRDNG